ncbi:MAG: cysteine--tRNA ligase [Anaerolineaceae bacterium]|nr:cysteine--tRNA ligase [Anaerolineaceae bacterium]
MTVKLFNTLSRKKEEFSTVEPGKVRMYVCGPTVYNKAHVGHAMSALVFDVIRRYLEYRDYDVKHAMNFTDVDDKIIMRAAEMDMDPFVLGRMYIDEFQQHLKDLNILPATFNPLATQEMDQIISMVSDLTEKGYAYAVDGDVYFRVLRDEDYGQLSGRKIEDMQSGSRIDVDDRKESPFDFALWKSVKPGEPFWESPWGNGRPGWHIECSAMSLHHLGEEIDIHGGGNDLIFPHHENEIAQTESVTGKQFARYWVHNGMLQLSGEKMSKSIGNLVTIEAFLEEHSADVLRMMVLNSGYRNPLTFNDEVIGQAKKALERLRSALKSAQPGVEGLAGEMVSEIESLSKDTKEKFIKVMDDDFNSAGALGVLFDLVRVINQSRDAGATDAQLQPAQEVITTLTSVLGLQLEEAKGKGHDADPFIDMLVKLRTDLRSQKMYAIGDEIRDQLAALNVVIEDSREGSTWHWQA